MIHINEAIVVEGIYDKIKVEQIVDAIVVVTNGFSIFKDEERVDLIKKLAFKRGIVLFTDSDRAGFLIRNYIKSFIPKEFIKDAYIPEISGKEKRKGSPSKEGILGVEGVSDDIIIKALEESGCTIGAYKNDASKKKGVNKLITKLDLYEDGLVGKDNSNTRRTSFLKELSLPSRLSSKSLLQILNAIYNFDEYKNLIKDFYKRTENK